MVDPKLKDQVTATPSSEAPIDVVHASEQASNLAGAIEAVPGQTQVASKQIPASPKKKKMEAVYIDQAALAQLQSFGCGPMPSVGLIHGVMQDQGSALINAITVLPRALKDMCTWTLSAEADDKVYLDALGLIVLYHSQLSLMLALNVSSESDVTQFSYIFASMFPRLPAGLEAVLMISVHRFINEDDSLVLKSVFNLYSADLGSKIKSVPCYRLASLGPTLATQSTRSLLVELGTIDKIIPSTFPGKLRSQLMRSEIMECDIASSKIFALNDETQIDRALVELRRNINQRVLELEQVWIAKRIKASANNNGEGNDETPKEDGSEKFRAHIAQLALKELAVTNASMRKRPLPSNRADYVTTIQVKPIKAPPTVKRKPPAKPKPKTKDEAEKSI